VQGKERAMVVEKGWMEQRQHGRTAATVNVTYRLLEPFEKENALNSPVYSETSMAQLPDLAKKFHSYHAVTKDIAGGTLSVTGEQKFISDGWVELSILPPKYVAPVTLLAEIKWVRSFSRLGKSLHTAGVSVLALNSESMDRFSRFLLAEKVRRDNESSGLKKHSS
jgi:hypothetical protein